MTTLQMQAGSSPAALRYGLRNDGNGNHAGGADAFTPVLDALDRVTVPAKFRRLGMSGMLGMPLTPVAITTWRGCNVRAVPSRFSVTDQRPAFSS